MKDWERTEAKKRFLEVLTNEQLSPRQIYGKAEEMGVYLSSEEYGELLLELLNEGEICVAKVDISYLPQIKNGPNGMLEAFFSAVR